MSDTVDDDATDPSADPSVDLRNFLSAEGHQTLELLEQVRGKYVTSPGDAVCMKALTKLILNAGMRANTALPYSRTNRAEGRILVITGESGAGKSRRLMRTLRRHPALEGQDLAGPDSPVVVVNVPSPCTLKLLGREVLHATGYPLERELLENLVWERVRRRLDRGNKLIVVFDEMQHITRKLNSDEINKVSDTIKNLINNLTWRVSIIVCGLPKVADFIHRDRQLERRAQFIHIDSLTMPGDNAVIAAMVTKLAAVADLIAEADIATNLAPRLIHAACNQWGSPSHSPMRPSRPRFGPITSLSTGTTTRSTSVIRSRSGPMARSRSTTSRRRTEAFSAAPTRKTRSSAATGLRSASPGLPSSSMPRRTETPRQVQWGDRRDAAPRPAL
ncbi:ATP-binding protein [Methylobacterium tardum]|uniref:ATP-binding protein n=1 Tax=Methylobacterium tardum TaxID=374432 RepID=UPI00361FC5C5